MRRLGIVLVGALAAVATLAPGAQAVDSTPAKTDVTNGTVNAVVPTADAIYIGGNFTKVGPRTGEWVGIDSSTAAITGLPPVSGGSRNGSVIYPSFVGAAAPDGSGGFYIGGGFTHVGGLARRNLAHILADGSVDPNFAPNPNGFEVDALAVSGSTVYVGGAFSSIGGRSRFGIAALNAATGNVKSWNPSPDSTGVDSLAVSGSTVYVGGSFDHIGGKERRCIAALDATTGAATSWNANAEPNATDYCGVRTIALAPLGGTVYVGGDFDYLGGKARKNIAALNTTTGAARSWNPNAQGGTDCGSSNDYTSVDALRVSGSLVYAGGLFTSIGGQARNNIAALDRTTGAATSWNPNATATACSPADVYTLAVSGSTVYAGGAFTSIGGQPRDGIAALNAASGAPTGWNPRINTASPNAGSVHALAVSGSTVYAGGRFAAISGKARSNVAALNPVTGKVTSWNPNANGEVDTLRVSGSTLYAGGNFTSIGGQARSRIAALDAATGAATSWNPNANGEVDALHISPSTVYAGGTFTSIGGQARRAIAALDRTTGNARGWNPNATVGGAGGSPPTINALTRSGSTIYAGGIFDHIGGQARNNVAALDAATGAATSWDPDSNGEINALSVSGSTVYVGGGFFSEFAPDSIGGQPRDGIAALDAATGVATSWNPMAYEWATVDALAVTGSTVYAGGAFSWPPANIAAFDRTTGAVNWGPIANGEVRALEFGPDGSLWAGGAFTGFDAAPQSSIARFAP